MREITTSCGNITFFMSFSEWKKFFRKQVVIFLLFTQCHDKSCFSHNCYSIKCTQNFTDFQILYMKRYTQMSASITFALTTFLCSSHSQTILQQRLNISSGLKCCLHKQQQMQYAIHWLRLATATIQGLTCRCCANTTLKWRLNLAV